MITKEKTYKKAFENKNKRVKEIKSKREIMLAAAYRTEPRLAEIDRHLSSAGASLAITALSGNGKKLDALKAECKALSAEKALLLEKAQVPPEKFECELCKDTGYVSGKICDCIKKEAAKIMTEEMSLQMPLSESRFDNFNFGYFSDKKTNAELSEKEKMSTVYKTCLNYANEFDPAKSGNLLLIGAPGLGKTHLTLAIVSAVINKGYLPLYGSAENLFSAIESEKFSGGIREKYEMALECDLLVIDDLGTELSTSFTKSVLYNLINTRTLTKKPTIINSNLSLHEIEVRYTPRIASRLIGGYDICRFSGKDVRQLKKLEKM